jgi:hypothetical protein
MAATRIDFFVPTGASLLHTVHIIGAAVEKIPHSSTTENTPPNTGDMSFASCNVGTAYWAISSTRSNRAAFMNSTAVISTTPPRILPSAWLHQDTIRYTASCFPDMVSRSFLFRVFG